MKTTRIMLAIGLFAAMSMLMAACGAELNPKFESSLNNALDAKNGEFKACYEAALEKDREAKGLMNLDIEFKADLIAEIRKRRSYVANVAGETRSLNWMRSHPRSRR